MANEGIMAAPMPMQQQRQQQPPQGYVSSLDAYDAASSAMQETNPRAFDEYKSAIGSSLLQLNLKPSEIEAFVTLLEYMMQYPDQYKEVIRAGIEAGAIEEGDFPAEFDQGFISTMLAALNEQRIQQAQNVAPEAMGPGPQEPMAMKSGGLADAAKALQARGRGRDTMLAHINPQEAAMLRRAGGLGTTNPYTGLKEYNFVSDLWDGAKNVAKETVNVVKDVAKSDIGRIALTIGLTMALSPLAAGYGIGAAGTAAIVGGGMSALGGGNIQDILKGAAMGYIGGSIAPSISGYMPGAAGSVLNQGLTGAALGTGFGLASGMSLKDSLKAGAAGGLTAGAVGYGQQQGYIPGGQATGPRPEVSADGSNLSLAPIESVGTLGTAVENLPPPSVTPSAGSEIGPNGIPYDQDPTFGYTNATADQLAQANKSSDPLGALTVDERYTDIDRNYANQLETVPADQTRLTPQQIESNVRKLTALENFTEGAKGLYNKASDAVVGGYDEYLSPSRPSIQQGNQDAILAGTRARSEYIQAARAEGLVPTSAGADAAYQTAYDAKAPGFFSKYAPLAGAALGATYLAGGFKEKPVDDKPIYDPAYTGEDYIKDNPEFFSGGFSDNYQSQGAGAYDPLRATTYTGGQGAAASPGVVTPTGIMQAQYSPDYGRRQVPAVQDYYSPFIGTSEPVMAAKGGMITAEPRHYAFGGFAKSIIDVIRRVKPEIIEGGARQVNKPAAIEGNTATPAPKGNTSAPAPKISTPSPVPKISTPSPVPPIQELYDAYLATTYTGNQSPATPSVVVPTGIMQAQYSPDYGRRRMRPVMAADGGSIREFPRKSGPINGPGTGTSDDIPAMLSDGEFVFTARAVRNAGGGSRRKGAARMYKLMKSLEKGGMVKG